MILQSEAPSAASRACAMIASYHGFRTDLGGMRMRLAPSMKGVTLKHISSIAEVMGMAARGVKVALESLSQLKLPAILHWDMNHFVVLTHVNGDTITVNDPARGRRVLKLAEASDHYTGVAMEMTPSAGFKTRDEREQISAWHWFHLTGLRGRSPGVFLRVLELLALALHSSLLVVISCRRTLPRLARAGLGSRCRGDIAIVTRALCSRRISDPTELQLIDTLFAGASAASPSGSRSCHMRLVSRFAVRYDPAHPDVASSKRSGWSDGAGHVP